MTPTPIPTILDEIAQLSDEIGDIEDTLDAKRASIRGLLREAFEKHGVRRGLLVKASGYSRTLIFRITEYMVP